MFKNYPNKIIAQLSIKISKGKKFIDSNYKYKIYSKLIILNYFVIKLLNIILCAKLIKSKNEKKYILKLNQLKLLKLIGQI
jgi:hypothetical protein